MLLNPINWLLQRITGILLIALLFLHLWKKHLYTTDSFIYKYIVVHLSASAWKRIDFSFLVIVLYHALNGLWGLVNDYVHHPQFIRGFLLLSVLTVIFCLIIGYGIVF